MARSGGLFLSCCIVLVAPTSLASFEVYPGADVGLAYTADTAAVVAGGREQGLRYLDNFDLTLRLEGDALFGIEGLTAFFYGLGNQGGSLSDLVGDSQTVSNIEAPTSWRLYEAWLEQTIATDRFSLLVGLYDVNSEFDRIESAQLFVHSSPGSGAEFAQSGQNGPSSFPFTSLGVRARANIGKLGLKLAVMDGVSGNPYKPGGTQIAFGARDGLLATFELDFSTGSRQSVLRQDESVTCRRLALGGWGYSARQPLLGNVGKRDSGAAGAYGLFDWRLSCDENGSGRTGVFGRFGVARERFYQFSQYAGAGVTHRAFVPGRNEDEFGLGFALAKNGVTYRRLTGTRSYEIALEIYYSAPLSKYVRLQLDLQQVVNPASAAGIPNATVVLLRAVVEA